jgi:tetratricopeptide (TPR) repeat protein
MRKSVLTAAILIAVGAFAATAQILEMENSYTSLQEALKKKDVAEVKRLATETSKYARQLVAEPKPTNADDVEQWTAIVAHSKEVDAYTEYALFASAVGGTPAQAIDLLTTLETQNPKSRYLDEGGYTRYFQALSQSGASAKITAVAEKALENLPNSLDVLSTLAEQSLSTPSKAVTYAQRLIAAASKATKPEGAAANWESKKSLALGRGYYISGMVQAQSQNFFEADKSLRAALPLVKGSDTMAAATLFFLGVANYNIGSQSNNKARVLEAANFSEQAANYKSQYASQAMTNAVAMRNAAAKMR